jgi:hypothetical protein
MLVTSQLRPLEHKSLVVALMCSPFGFGLWANVYASAHIESSRLGIHAQVGSLPLVLDPIQGPLIVEHQRRANRMKDLHRAIESLSRLGENVVVVFGVFEPEMTYEATRSRARDDRLKGLLTASEIEGHVRARRSIYYMDGQDAYSLENGVDLHRWGARPLR